MSPSPIVNFIKQRNKIAITNSFIILTNVSSFLMFVYINKLFVQMGITFTSTLNYRFSNVRLQMQEGLIQVIYGPMFSGKSSELLRKIRRYEHAKKNCLVINYIHENRYTSAQEMATHDRITRKALKTADLMSLLDYSSNYDVIGIDQGQFFAQIVQFSETMANKDKIIIIAALDGTFQRKPFGNILNLIPKAEKVTKLNAVCVQCTKQAAFTKRVVDSKQIELIGGAEMYKPVCRACFFAAEKNEKEASKQEFPIEGPLSPEK